MSKRIGPSMSTEPGWMAASRGLRYYLRSALCQRPQNDPSMLLSFERPASAGHREDASKQTRPSTRGDQPAFTPLHGP
jgi:hypothetical protein